MKSHPAPSGASTPVHSVLLRLATFRSGFRSVVPLEGGLTNRNYKVATDLATYVVRIAAPASGGLAIDREIEHANSCIAAATGVAASVVEWQPEVGAMVFSYIDGVTLTDTDLAAPGTLQRVAESCRRLHSGARFVNEFDMFAVQRGYRAMVRTKGFALPNRYDDYADLFAQVERALSIRAHATVPCNNDLLAANLIDDGREIRIIDYEYSGNNDPAFELGNLWSESRLDDDQLVELVRAYFGSVTRNQVARVRLHALVAQYGWTLWAAIQAATSPIDFDYWSWGMEKFESARRMFGHAGLDRLLENVTIDD